MRVSASAAALSSDHDLVERIFHDDRLAFVQLHSRYATTLYAEAYRLTWDSFDAEQVVEAVFAQVRWLAGWLRTTPLNLHPWLLDQTRSLARAMVVTGGMRAPVATRRSASESVEQDRERKSPEAAAHGV